MHMMHNIVFVYDTIPTCLRTIPTFGLLVCPSSLRQHFDGGGLVLSPTTKTEEFWL
jgi:hypothetical protein